MRTARLKWTLLGILTVAVAALAPDSTPATYADSNGYITPDPPASFMVQGAWYDSEVTLLEPFVGSTSHDRVKVSDTSLLRPGWTIEIVSDHGPIPERMTILALVGQCDEAVDDDGDTLVNDGCPVVDDGVPHPETGAQCDNALDDDGDTKVNDGCPVFDDGVPQPETGTQCDFNYDDDGDTVVNDGCPAVDAGGPHPETGAQCDDSIDNDEDNWTNDGCPAVSAPETGDQCNAANDDDGDGKVNDGCPVMPRAEWGSECSNNIDDDQDGKINDGCFAVDVDGEPGSECTNMLDDDSDGKVNDGCPKVGAASESGTQCSDIFDNDGDTVANDGCPAVGAAEETNRCANAVDDDLDGHVNDGCPEYHLVAETPFQCANALDDDGDGYVNDGCAAYAGAAETATRDTMVVQRAVNDVRDSHSAGLPIRDHLFRTDIWVRDVPSTDVYGVGTFQLYVHFDPTQLEYLKSTLDLSWLTSTGRSVAYTAGPTLENGDTIHASCVTSGDIYNPPWPKGPTGSGRIATAWFRVLSPDSLVSRNFMLTGTTVYDINSAEITSLVANGALRTVTCPDANLDGKINMLDAVNVRLNLGDTGKVSGATLTADIDAVQTTIPISGQGSLAVGTIVAINNEHLRITGFDTGPTMTVERGIYNRPPPEAPTNVPHSDGTAIFIAYSGGLDGKLGFTDPRDTNDDLKVDGRDAVPVYGVLNFRCPK